MCLLSMKWVFNTKWKDELQMVIVDFNTLVMALLGGKSCMIKGQTKKRCTVLAGIWNKEVYISDKLLLIVGEERALVHECSARDSETLCTLSRNCWLHVSCVSVLSLCEMMLRLCGGPALSSWRALPKLDYVLRVMAKLCCYWGLEWRGSGGVKET